MKLNKLVFNTIFSIILLCAFSLGAKPQLIADINREGPNDVAYITKSDIGYILIDSTGVSWDFYLLTDSIPKYFSKTISGDNNKPNSVIITSDSILFFDTRSGYLMRDSLSTQADSASKVIDQTGYEILGNIGDSIIISYENSLYTMYNEQLTTWIENDILGVPVSFSDLYEKNGDYWAIGVPNGETYGELYSIDIENQTATRLTPTDDIGHVNLYKADYHTDLLYFLFNNTQIWVSNGTPAGTYSVATSTQTIYDFCISPDAKHILTHKTRTINDTLRIYNIATQTFSFLNRGTIWNIDCAQNGVVYSAESYHSDLRKNFEHVVYQDYNTRIIDTLTRADQSSASGDPFEFFKIFQDSILLYSLDEPIYGRELRKCNTNTGSCAIIEDIWPGSGSSINTKIYDHSPYLLIEDSLFIKSKNPFDGTNLRKYDFQKNQLSNVFKVNFKTNASHSSNFCFWRDSIYFSSQNSLGGSHNVYSTDTNGSTPNLLTKFTGKKTIQTIAPLGKNLVYIAVEKDGTGVSGTFWVYSLSSENNQTQLLLEKNGRVSGFKSQIVGNQVHIAINAQPETGGYWRDIWFRTDGDTIEEVPTSYNELSNTKIIGTTTFSGKDVSIWEADYNSDTKLLALDNTSSSLTSLPSIDENLRGSQITDYPDMLLYSRNGTNGNELWKLDENGINEVADILPGAQGSTPKLGATLADNQFYFSAHGIYKYAIYRTNGTHLGTNMVHKISSSASGCSDISNIYKLDSIHIAYFAKCEDSKFRAYISDTSEYLPRQIKGLELSSLSIGANYVIQGSLVFSDNNEINSWWRLDPHADTIRKLDMNTFEKNGYIYHQKLFASYSDPSIGMEPHVWDIREAPVISYDQPSITSTEDSQIFDTIRLKDYLSPHQDLSVQILNSDFLENDGRFQINHLQSFEYEISITPDTNTCGNKTLNIQATNRFGLSTTKSIPLNIQCINDAPTVTLSPSLTLPEDSSQTYKFYLGLDDGDPEEDQKITFSTPEWDAKNLGEAKITQSNDSIFLEFSPTEHWNGSKDLILKWKDDGGTVDGGVDTLKHSLKVTLKPVEDEPEFIASTDTATMDALELNLNTLFADPDSINQDTLKFSAEITSGSAAKIDLKGDQLSITPLRGVKGQVVIQLSATDKAGNTTTQDLKINVGTTGLESFAVGSANVHVLSQGLRIETVVDSKLEIFDLQGKPLYSEQFFGKGEQYRSFAEMNLQSSQGYLVRVNTATESSAQIFNLNK